MTEGEIRKLTDAIERLLRPSLSQSEALRDVVSSVGAWLCELASRGANADSVPNPVDQAAASVGAETSSRGATPSTANGNATPIAAQASVAASPNSVVAGPRELLPLRLGDARTRVAMVGDPDEMRRARDAAHREAVAAASATYEVASPVAETDLALVAARSRLKAESCRHMIARRASLADPEQAERTRQEMDALIARAKSMTECFLWVYWRDRTTPDDATLLRAADCYDALADALELLRALEEAGFDRASPDAAEAMQYAAEACSAMRVALANTWISSERDQHEIHVWLRRQTATHRVFIQRYMTVDDPADPAAMGDLRRRIAARLEYLQQRSNREKNIRKTLNQMRYHAGRINGDDPAEDEAHWRRIGDALTVLCESGLAWTDRRIAESIGVTAARLWRGEAGDGVLARVVARLLDVSVDAPADDEPASERPAIWSDAVRDVRTMLRGGRIVVIGGHRNGEAVDRYVDAFELSEVDWVELQEHGPSSPMYAAVRRDDTTVVAVIVRLTGHLHAEEARQIARAGGKPCVLLTGGYNPEQFARAVLEQASERLIS